jgi:hypothetical protein
MGQGSTVPDNEQMPSLNESGRLTPSKRLDGPWRGVETVDSVFAASMQAAGVHEINAQGMDFGTVNGVDGLLSVDEVIQQQLLMDLFWPGWPASLPEPHIVNDLYVKDPIDIKL